MSETQRVLTTSTVSKDSVTKRLLPVLHGVLLLNEM